VLADKLVEADGGLRQAHAQARVKCAHPPGDPGEPVADLVQPWWQPVVTAFGVGRLAGEHPHQQRPQVPRVGVTADRCATTEGLRGDGEPQVPQPLGVGRGLVVGDEVGDTPVGEQQPSGVVDEDVVRGDVAVDDAKVLVDRPDRGDHRCHPGDDDVRGASTRAFALDHLVKGCRAPCHDVAPQLVLVVFDTQLGARHGADERLDNRQHRRVRLGVLAGGGDH